MSVFFGLFGINLLFVLLLPLSVLTLAFVLHRTRDRDPLDLATGVSAYASLMLVVSAIVVVIGVGHFLTGVFGTLDSGFTYGDDGFPGELFGEDGSNDNDSANMAQGIAWAAIGGMMAAAHIVLRTRLATTDQLDGGVESAVEAIVAVGAGVFGLLFAAMALGAMFERAVVDSSAAAPGQTAAYAVPVLAIWALYSTRVLRRLGLLGRPDPAL